MKVIASNFSIIFVLNLKNILMNKEEFYAKIDHSLQQVKEGRVTRQHDGETVTEFIERLLVYTEDASITSID